MKFPIAKNLFLIFVSVLFALLICEVVSRIVYPIDLSHFVGNDGSRESIFVPDKDLGFRNKKNFDGWLISPEYKNRIFTNSYGFRGRENYPKKSDKFRIMALGDSFTFGVGVNEDETYIKRLGKYIQDQLSIPTEAYNLGVGAYGTIQEYLVFQKFQFLKPDLVIIGFLARDTFAEEGGNDLIDNFNFYKKYVKDKKEDLAVTIPIERKMRNMLRHHSNLYRMVELNFGGYLRKKYYPKSDNPELKKEAWKITMNYLRKFDERLHEINIPGLLLWVPFPGNAVNGDSAVPNKIRKMGFKKLILVNPLELFASNPMEYYYPLDGHWNKKGHEKASQALFSEMIKMKILENWKNRLNKR